MSDTPRTDAEAFYLEPYGREQNADGQYVDTDFARTLERELSAAIARAESAENASKNWYETALANARDCSKAEAECDTLRAELDRLTTQRLWVWRNFSATKRELWVFDNPFPVRMDSDDPQTLGEPYGYAIFKPSRRGRADITDEQVMERMMRANIPTPKEAK